MVISRGSSASLLDTARDGPIRSVNLRTESGALLHGLSTGARESGVLRPPPCGPLAEVFSLEDRCGHPACDGDLTPQPPTIERNNVVRTVGPTRVLNESGGQHPEWAQRSRPAGSGTARHRRDPIGNARPGARFDVLCSAWLDDFRSRGVTEVGFGDLTLRRPAGTALAAVVGACDRTLSLAAIVGAVAQLLEADEEATLAEILPELRELVETAMLLAESTTLTGRAHVPPT